MSPIEKKGVEKTRAYHAANREKINAHKRAQRALKKAACWLVMDPNLGFKAS